MSDSLPYVSLFIEGFFYGLYSGIFAMYIQCPPNGDKSRTATILFYALCVLYILSTVSFASDLTNFILELRGTTLSPELQIDMLPILYRLYVVQTTVSGCCDCIAQCVIIYRCWIVWGQNISVVIFPSFLAIAYLVLWLATIPATTVIDGSFYTVPWGAYTALTALTSSMVVNTLVTSLIVFRILKVFLEVKAATTSIERTLGSTRSSPLQHILFVIIESGMTLFAIQLVRLVLYLVPSVHIDSIDFIIGINEMFNGIAPTIILVRVSMKMSFDDKESFIEAAGGSLRFNNPPSDPSSTPQQVGSGTSSTAGNMLFQEENEVV